MLVILGIPPMLTNTYAGIAAVDPAARDAASGMGMTGGQVLRRVELPIALPLIISGIRSAFLQIVATATIAAYVSLGGLGRYLIDGPKAIVNPYGIMAGGAVLVALLAIIGDRVIAGIGAAGGLPRADRAPAHAGAPPRCPPSSESRSAESPRGSAPVTSSGAHLDPGADVRCHSTRCRCRT